MSESKTKDGSTGYALKTGRVMLTYMPHPSPSTCISVPTPLQPTALPRGLTPLPCSGISVCSDVCTALLGVVHGTARVCLPRPLNIRPETTLWKPKTLDFIGFLGGETTETTVLGLYIFRRHSRIVTEF